VNNETDYDLVWNSLSNDTKKYAIPNSEHGGKTGDAIFTLYRRNEEARKEISKILDDRVEGHTLFSLYMAVVECITLIVGGPPSSLIFFGFLFGILFFCGQECLYDSSIFVIPLTVMSIPLLVVYYTFSVLTLPIGLIAIVLDLIVGTRAGIRSPSKSIVTTTSESNENDSQNSLIILTQVQDALMDLKCQLEWIQCQLKNLYISLKSIVEK
jgi:hypothetical protein